MILIFFIVLQLIWLNYGNENVTAQFLYKNRLQCKEQVAIAMICEVHKQPNVELSFHLYHNYSGDS